jgi:hypothetical protein
MTMSTRLTAPSAALALLVWTTSAFAQALPAAPASGTTSREKAAEYTFTAEAPGMLTVVVRGDASADLALALTDAEGQEISRVDGDVGGNTAAEQLMVQIGQAGAYRITVETFGGTATFKIGSSFVPFPELATPPDPDGSPRRAQVVAANKAIEDSINPQAGDNVDWFVFKAPAAGTVTAVTRGLGDGDLVLEAFANDDFRRPVNRSDQDMQDNAGNESVTASVAAGQSVYFRVSANWRGATEIPYRLTIGFIPD